MGGRAVVDAAAGLLDLRSEIAEFDSEAEVLDLCREFGI